MGFRFQRRIRIAPGVRLNLSKSGIGASVGRTGLRLGMDAKRKFIPRRCFCKTSTDPVLALG